MTVTKSTADFCRYAFSSKNLRFFTDPEGLAELFRSYFEIDCTPKLQKIVVLSRSLGVKIQAASYLETGGTNMFARGYWHIHYSAKDKPATQKFDILHELFEVIHKVFHSLYPGYTEVKEPYLSRYADRFAAAVLIPRRFFLQCLVDTGCDLVKMGNSLELSLQSLLVAMKKHVHNVPFVGALYEYHLPDGIPSRYITNEYTTSMVVKSGPAKMISNLCWLQSAPVSDESPNKGSLVCAALYGNCSILYNNDGDKDSYSVLVRPVLGTGKRPYRLILLALPGNRVNRFSPQVDTIETVRVGEDSLCPSAYQCRHSENCRWKNNRRS